MARTVVVSLLAGISAVLLAQLPKETLEPEAANEALLNRLQPPDKVKDITGLEAGTAAAEIEAGKGRCVVQMAAAGPLRGGSAKTSLCCSSLGRESSDPTRSSSPSRMP